MNKRIPAIFALLLLLLTSCADVPNPTSSIPQTVTPLPTEEAIDGECPPYSVIDGQLYRLSGQQNTYTEDQLTDYFLGEIISTVDLSQMPQHDFESNYLPVGSRVYSHPDHEDWIVIFQEGESADAGARFGMVAVVE